MAEGVELNDRGLTYFAQEPVFNLQYDKTNKLNEKVVTVPHKVECKIKFQTRGLRLCQKNSQRKINSQ